MSTTDSARTPATGFSLNWVSASRPEWTSGWWLKRTKPDGAFIHVRIVESGWLREGEESPPGVTAVAESLVVQIKSEPARQGYIHIIDVRNDNRLITAIEFLSPSNKLPGDGREQYVQKQKETCGAGAGLVEIDLVRVGKRPTLAQAHLPASRDRTYQVCIYRPSKPGQCQVICIPLAARLPAIPVPLRPSEAEATLDLQMLIEQAYRNGVYGNELDYSKPCNPPLEGAEAQWAKELLPPHGKQSR